MIVELVIIIIDNNNTIIVFKDVVIGDMKQSNNYQLCMEDY